MTRKSCLSWALLFLLGGTRAHAQMFGRGPNFHGPDFHPAPLPHNQFWGARPVFPHDPFFFPHHFGFFPPTPFFFGHQFGPFPDSRFFFPHHRFWPFFPQSFGPQSFGSGFYGFGSATPFVSPFGPGPDGRYRGAYGSAPPAYEGTPGEASPDRPRGREKSQPAPSANAPRPLEPGQSEIDSLNPSAVIVTLDGREQVAPSAGALTIGSGQHTLRIAARPSGAGSATPAKSPPN